MRAIVAGHRVSLFQKRFLGGCRLLSRPAALATRRLASFAGWSAREDERTADVRFSTGVRSTLADSGDAAAASGGGEYLGGAAPAGALHVIKDTMAHVDVVLADGIALRVAVAAEDPSRPPLRGVPVDSVRLKARSRFCLTGGIAFDLTRVRTGATRAAAVAAPTEYEIEVEWCGQRAEARSPEALADDFLLRIEDVVAFKRRAQQLALEAAAAAARPAAQAAAVAAAAPMPAPAAPLAAAPAPVVAAELPPAHHAGSTAKAAAAGSAP